MVRRAIRTGPLLAVMAVAAWLAVATPGLAQAPPVADWSQWRGPNRDGISLETGLLKQWPTGGPPRVWQTAGAGIGYSSFSSSGGRLYTIGARDEVEYVMAFDRASGRKLWETPNGRRFRNEQGDGPRSTPTTDGDLVYAFGGSGELSCLDAATGRKVWSVNVVQQFGGSTPYWGYSESPLIVGDRLVINPGGRRAALAAVNKATGAMVWQQPGDDAGYSSPMLLRTGSLQQVVFFTAERGLAVDPRDGRLLWSYDRAANGTANIATPIVHGNRVFFSSDYGTGAALLDVRASGNLASASEVYFTRDMRNHHASSVLVGPYLYGFSSSILTSLVFDTGAVAWRNRSVGKGSLIYADQRLYLYSENGVAGLADASADGYVERGRFTLSTGNASTWSHPIITNGLLILRDQDRVYAFDVRAH